MAVRLTGGRMDQKETHKCFSSNRVWKTDIKAPLLDLMAEQSESAGGEGFGLFGASPVTRERRPRLILAATWTFVQRRLIINPLLQSPGKRRCSRADSGVPKPSCQHKQITSVSFFIVSPGAARQIPPAGLHHGDPR